MVEDKNCPKFLAGGVFRTGQSTTVMNGGIIRPVPEAALAPQCNSQPYDKHKYKPSMPHDKLNLTTLRASLPENSSPTAKTNWNNLTKHARATAVGQFDVGKVKLQGEWEKSVGSTLKAGPAKLLHCLRNPFYR